MLITLQKGLETPHVGLDFSSKWPVSCVIQAPPAWSWDRQRPQEEEGFLTLRTTGQESRKYGTKKQVLNLHLDQGHYWASSSQHEMATRRQQRAIWLSPLGEWWASNMPEEISKCWWAQPGAKGVIFLQHYHWCLLTNSLMSVSQISLTACTFVK